MFNSGGKMANQIESELGVLEKLLEEATDLLRGRSKVYWRTMGSVERK
jgi:hypothetical protein